MKSTRRKFLQQLAASTAWAALAFGGDAFARDSLSAGTQEAILLPDPETEEFWEKIRAYYDLPSQTYLNTATLGLMSKPVLASVNDRFQELSKGKYYINDEPRQAVARMLGVSEDTISLTHNTTDGINIIAQGLKLRKGDEVILTDQEHVGNALPWLNRARRSGIKLKVLQQGATAAETLSRLSALISRRTRVIAIPHVNCTIGQIAPVQEIAKLAKKKGILTFFDGAHGPGMLFPNLAEIDCDFYACCAHKWLGGPAGTGMLYIKKDKLELIEPIMVGAYSDTGWNIDLKEQEFKGFVDTAHRFDYGTQNAALLVGMQRAIEFMEEIGFDRIKERIHALGSYLQQQLLQRSFVEMLTPTESQSRAGIIGFRLKGRTIDDFEKSSLAQKFRLRIVPEAGLNSFRVSAHLHTSYSDLDQFVQGLEKWMSI